MEAKPEKEASICSISDLIILASLTIFSSTVKKIASFILLNWNAFVVYKLIFPSTFMIKHKAILEFLLQLSFEVFMQDPFKIDISLPLKFHIESTQLGNCWKLLIFNQRVSYMLDHFIKAFLAWIYFFLINITVFSCYVSLARPVIVKLFGLDFLNYEAYQLCLNALVQASFRKWNQGWWSRIIQPFN